LPRLAARAPPSPAMREREGPYRDRGRPARCGLEARGPSRALAQERHAGLGAVFVLLRGAAADAAGAFDDAVPDDRHGALAHDHLTARGGGDAARRRLVGARRHLAAGPAERRRGDRLSLAAISRAPDRIVHAL